MKILQLFDLKYLEYIHLRKDVGMYPVYLQHKRSYHSTILYLSSDHNALGNNFRKISLIEAREFLSFLPDNFFFYYFKRLILIYKLIICTKKNDILMLFHLRYENLLYIMIYKMLNPSGKVYLKLDININVIERLEYLKKINKFRSLKLLQILLKKVDLISTEVYDLIPLLNQFLGVDISKKLIYSPNGFDDANNYSVLPYDKKANIMLTVGRIGSPQKNNAMMLKALNTFDLRDWKIYFIGPIEESFRQTIVDFYNTNPCMKEKIHFIGSIDDKDELYSWYNKAKVFFLTSGFEGFPLVFPEALYFGNYIITTDVGGAKDITKNGENGTIIGVDDVELLRKTISDVISGSIDLEKYYYKNIQLANEKFIYSKIISNLDEKLRSL